MNQLRVFMKTGTPPKKFSESFKRKIVKEFESGLLNKDQLQRKYGIGGNSVVLEWCRKYGKLAYHTATENGRPMKDPQKQRIKELEKKLKAAELKIKVYDKLIEITNRELDADVLKKIEARLSENWPQPEE
jgi:transposase-like protein